MKQSAGTTSIARKAAFVATALGLWGALVLVFAAPSVLNSPESLRQAVGFGCFFWAPWLLFIPLVAWISLRFPIERRRLLTKLGLHLLACVAIVGASQIFFRRAELFFFHPEKPMPERRWPGENHPPHGPKPQDALLGLRAALDVLVYWSLLGVCQAITNFRSSQERERRAAELEARLTRSKLQALRMQINPHFLFNTLNAVATLVHVNPKAADEMLGDLSDLFRRSLDSMDEQEIPLARELEFIGSYINIEQRRFGDRLRVEQKIPEELKNALVPALILQPLVENAIRHGIEPRRGPGLVTIEARLEGRNLRLIVRDDGKGLPAEDPAGPARRGIGLANAQARLRGLYGDDQQFSFGKAEPQGCQVDIRFPFHLEAVSIPTAPIDPAT